MLPKSPQSSAEPHCWTEEPIKADVGETPEAPQDTLIPTAVCGSSGAMSVGAPQ